MNIMAYPISPDASERSGIPYYQVSTDDVSGLQGLEAFRQSVQDLFALTPLSAAPYRIDMIAWHLGTLMLGSVRSSALAFDRPASLVAASGLDHLLVQLYVEGGFTGTADTRPVVVTPGDIVVFDTTRTLHTRASDFGNITLLIPRSFFAATHADVSALHGRVLPAGGAFTGVLASYMIALAERLPALDAREGDLAARSTAALITAVLASHDDRGPAAVAIPSPFRKIALEIDRRLRDPALDAEALAEALGMSRATLYRAFEPAGGIADFIRRRRLSAALVAIAASENQRRKIGEIAFECGFASESAFNRAFKAAYGVPPSEARQRSVRLWSMADEAGKPVGSLDFARWMRTLRG